MPKLIGLSLEDITSANDAKQYLIRFDGSKRFILCEVGEFKDIADGEWIFHEGDPSIWHYKVSDINSGDINGVYRIEL